MGLETLLMAFLVGVLCGKAICGKASRFVRVYIEPCGGKTDPHIRVSFSGGTAVMGGRVVELGEARMTGEAVS